MKLGNNEYNIRTGIGFDAHRLESGIALFIGGVEIPYEQGLHGHSDGDVLIHAIIDSLLGAANLGDIGKYFPSDNLAFKDIDSTVMLKNIIPEIDNANWQINYIDTTIIAEKPKLNGFIDKMKTTLSHSMNISKELISVKAKTTDGMGFPGKSDGIAALAIATLKQNK